jgi:hypothetical protein
MSTTPHLFLALSGHGFGHIAQVAPVMAALRARRPDLRLTVQSPLPEPLLRQRLSSEFLHIPQATDVGMVMASAVEVKRDASLAAYRELHARWDTRLVEEIALLEQLAPDLLFADIPYLPLAAAARISLPAVALCSLHWADIVGHYFPGHPEMAVWRAVMLDAYRSAAVFLRPAPSMPMPDLPNTRAIGPVAFTGRNRRPELNARLGLRGDETLVLIALGGVDMPLRLENWPLRPESCWLVPPAWGTQRADVRDWSALADLSFIDLTCSCDVMLTKPGYGAFAEAACNGKPVLYVERGDWPETACLVEWLEAHGNARCIERGRLETGEVVEPMAALLAQPRKPPLLPVGIAEAVACLCEFLGE